MAYYNYSFYYHSFAYSWLLRVSLSVIKLLIHVFIHSNLSFYFYFFRSSDLSLGQEKKLFVSTNPTDPNLGQSGNFNFIF